MKRMRWMLAGLAALAAAWAAGPAVDSQAPPLKIEPLNIDGGALDVIEKANGKPCVVFLVPQPDEEAGKLAIGLEQGYQKLKATGFTAAAVFVGGDEIKDAVKKGCQEHQVQIPVAVVSADSELLKPWKLGDETRNLMVFIKGGKIKECLENVGEGDRDKIMAAALKILQ